MEEQKVREGDMKGMYPQGRRRREDNSFFIVIFLFILLRFLAFFLMLVLFFLWVRECTTLYHLGLTGALWISYVSIYHIWPHFPSISSLFIFIFVLQVVHSFSLLYIIRCIFLWLLLCIYYSCCCIFYQMHFFIVVVYSLGVYSNCCC